MIFHICRREEWEAAQKAGFYTADSLESEGFIHCSKAEHIAGVANAFYKRIEGLVLLHIGEDMVQEEIRWDEVEGEVFPHIYGSINLDAVVEVEEFEMGEDGVFRYP